MSPKTSPKVGADGLRVAIMTSGGDAPGMNPCIRSLVRRSFRLGMKAFAILEGYSGLLSGDAHIVPLTWRHVSGLLQQGGTILGTSRCPEFLKPAGRRLAVKNLLHRGISRLVVIGGDGSLTGANLLVHEWAEHVAALLAAGEIAPEVASLHPRLYLVGIIGSIDNDFEGTQMTIGADSALHRILEATDSIMTTASSHQRAFVIEVMGRECGFLAIQTALAIGADFAFIPEDPIPDWEARLTACVARNFRLGRRLAMIILSEGSRDVQGRMISANDVKAALEKTLNLDTRITILGHVQRGGRPSAFDRLLGTRMGVTAIATLLDMDDGDPEPRVVCSCFGILTTRMLIEKVTKTRAITEAIRSGDFARALASRTQGFQKSWGQLKAWINTTYHLERQHDGPRAPVQALDDRPPFPAIAQTMHADQPAIAVVNIGPPSPGMNGVLDVLTRVSSASGWAVYGVYEGCPGLWEGNYERLSWAQIDGWGNAGGVALGTSTASIPRERIGDVAAQLSQRKVRALVMLGGWEATMELNALHQASDEHPALKIPIVVIPATIFNDMPCSLTSIGVDTALNSILGAIDCIKQSAIAYRRCLYILEIDAGRVDYLLLNSALAGGAHFMYGRDRPICLSRLLDDARALQHRFKATKTMALLINSDVGNKTYGTGLLSKILSHESEGRYTVRQVILGCTQYGTAPSPYDRYLSSVLTHAALDLIEKSFGVCDTGCHGMIGLAPSGITFFTVEELNADINWEAKRPWAKPSSNQLQEVYEALKGTRRYTADANRKDVASALIRGSSIRQLLKSGKDKEDEA